jgi:hypothetical protein
LHVNFQNCLATLNAIPAFQKTFLYALAIHVSAVRRSEVAQKTTRRRYLKQAMMAGKETIFGKKKMSVLAAADQERIVLIENELLPVVRTRQDSQRYTHRWQFIY